jgi:hypothetical protein
VRVRSREDGLVIRPGLHARLLLLRRRRGTKTGTGVRVFVNAAPAGRRVGEAEPSQRVSVYAALQQQRADSQCLRLAIPEPRAVQKSGKYCR